MNWFFGIATALAITAALAGSPPALAQPMKCSGEESVCITNCGKIARTGISRCVTTCGARRSACMRTGCWDNGSQRYCGLAKQ